MINYNIYKQYFIKFNSVKNFIKEFNVRNTTSQVNNSELNIKTLK